jgi:ribonucleoside-diphosphate reductase alpha subunit
MTLYDTKKTAYPAYPAYPGNSGYPGNPPSNPPGNPGNSNDNLKKINVILKSILKESKFSNNDIDISLILSKIFNKIPNNISERDLYQFLASTCSEITVNTNYVIFGGNILIYYLHQCNVRTFTDTMNYIQQENHNMCEDWLNKVNNHKEEYNDIIDYKRDYNIDYFGYKTLEKSYLLKDNKKNVIEKPQDLFMRTSITVSGYNSDSIKETYNLLSNQEMIHATPTLFNSGTKNMQLSSCYLLGADDSVSSIMNLMSSCAQISKWAGGIGLHISNIRSKGSMIKSTGGLSNGIVPMLKIFDGLSRWINQGGKRPGSIVAYLEPHHADVFDFLELRKNVGADEMRAKDLFLGLWISDNFMRCVKENKDWYLMSPDDCPGLEDVYGEEYDNLYNKYILQRKYREKVPALKLWGAIMYSQMESGMPYIMFKDTINKMNNQKNLGTIKSSNLCAEIVEFSNEKEHAVCNLASIGLPKMIKKFNTKNISFVIYTKPECKFCNYSKNYIESYKIKYEEISYTEESLNMLQRQLNITTMTYPQIFVETNKGTEYIGGWNELYKYLVGEIDYDKLRKVAYKATKNLNNVIDINYYPTEETRLSNMKHRPIGLGIQGLNDVLFSLKKEYESREALEINAKIMETIYLGAMEASVNDTNDKPYSSFDGSFFREGKFQFNLHNKNIPLSYETEWIKLREKVIKYGTKNSLLTALMPTASTSQIMGNTESFEPITSNMYVRKTQAGEFIVINKHLIDDLIAIKLWNDNVKQDIFSNDGSIQSLLYIPENIRDLYKTVWEIKQKAIHNSAIARAPFVDQSQSMNIYFADPDNNKLSSSHFYAWENNLKTGIYYLRSKPAVKPIAATISNNKCGREGANAPSTAPAKTNEEYNNKPGEECINCSS